jgi:hypothetical protein
MTSARLFRITGSGLLAGAILFIVHVVLRSLITAGVDPASFAKAGFWVPINILGVVGAALVLLGLPVLYVWIASPAGLLGLIGVALLGMAWLFFGVFLSLYSVLVLPWLADQAPLLVAASAPLPAALMIAFIVGIIAWLFGTVLIAAPFIRRRLHPRWVGYILPASAVWVVLGNLIIAPSGPASNLAVNLASNLGPVLLLVGIGYLGHLMRSGHDAVSVATIGGSVVKAA